jgi:hypothetical protein
MGQLPVITTREITLTLPHHEMCQILGAVNWCRRALAGMPAGLHPPLKTLDSLEQRADDIRKALDA